jgi:hypothetical protein
VFFGIPVYLKSQATKFAEKISPDGNFTAKYYGLDGSIFYPSLFYVTINDNRTQKNIFTSELLEFYCGTDILWPKRRKILLIGTCINFELP